MFPKQTKIDEPQKELPVKETTGLTGLKVQPGARDILLKLYKQTFEALEEIEEGTPYRKWVEKFTTYRVNIIKEEEDIFKIEEKIDCGQVEQLIMDAEHELDLIPKMAKQKPWEKPKWHNPPMIYDKIRD